MDTHSFVSALLYALIGFETFISRPMHAYVHALSLQSSSSLLDTLSPATSIVEEHQHNKKISNNSNKNRSNNSNVGSDASSNNILASNANQICKISEWKCPNGTCIPLSKYCNGVLDCMPDQSDEPSECSGKKYFF